MKTDNKILLVDVLVFRMKAPITANSENVDDLEYPACQRNILSVFLIFFHDVFGKQLDARKKLKDRCDQ